MSTHFEFGRLEQAEELEYCSFDTELVPELRCNFDKVSAAGSLTRSSEFVAAEQAGFESANIVEVLVAADKFAEVAVAANIGVAPVTVDIDTCPPLRS